LIGGRSLVETSAEVRWRATKSFGLVAFVDAGAAGEDVTPPIDDMRAGAGLGLRYYAGFGPLRADIALPLDKREGDSDFQIYISIGQAF
jgi:translocation and assembly module TamA